MNKNAYFSRQRTRLFASNTVINSTEIRPVKMGNRFDTLNLSRKRALSSVIAP